MSEQISISTATQGTNTAASKAHANGKGSGFLGMLMAAIGHKPAAHVAAHASDSSHEKSDQHNANPLINMDTKVATDSGHSEATLPVLVGKGDPQETKAIKTKVNLLGTKGTASTSKNAPTLSDMAKNDHVQTSKAIKAKTNLLTALGAKDAASTGHKNTTLRGDHAQATHVTKSGNSQDKTSSLIDSDNKSVAGNHHGDTLLLASTSDGASKEEKSPKTKMAKNEKTVTGKRHVAKNQHELAAGKVMDGPGMAVAATAMQQTAVSTDAKVHNDAQSSVPIKGLADGPILSAVTTTKAQIKSNKPVTSSHKESSGAPAMPKPMDKEAPDIAKSMISEPEPMDSSEGTPVQGSVIATQSAENIAAAGPQVEDSQIGKGGMHDSGTASLHANTAKAATIASTKQAAQIHHEIKVTTGTKITTHPQDAAAENTHAGSSDASNTAAYNPSIPQTGIHLYTQMAGGQAQRTIQANLIAHIDHPIGKRTRMPAGDTAMNGQDTAAGTAPLTANLGIGQGSPAMANPQSAMPQAPVHASGPWTAMAAMQEIGRATTNGQTRLELKLEPAHLGKVHVRIDSDSQKNIQVHLVVEQASSRQIIEQQLPSLRHALEQQGLNLGNFSMSSHQQGGGQGAGQPEQQASMVNMPDFSGTQASTPQFTSAPNEPLGAGRLSIRI